jgi:hypothetical protein
MGGTLVARDLFWKSARRRLRQAVGQSPPRKATRTPRKSRSELAEQVVARIVASVDAPVSVDFEGGYSEDDGELADNISRLIDLGVIGINFEDRIVRGSGLYGVDRQARRLFSDTENFFLKKNFTLTLNPAAVCSHPCCRRLR